jgi:hypothetical protein
MIDLYDAPTPNGWEISIMLEEIGLPDQVIPVNIRADEQFRPKFLPSSRGRHAVTSPRSITLARGYGFWGLRRSGAPRNDDDERASEQTKAIRKETP